MISLKNVIYSRNILMTQFSIFNIVFSQVQFCGIGVICTGDENFEISNVNQRIVTLYTRFSTNDRLR